MVRGEIEIVFVGGEAVQRVGEFELGLEVVVAFVIDAGGGGGGGFFFGSRVGL